MDILSLKQKQYLKGLAQALNPVVILGHKGLTPAILKEIEVNLTAHELIKVRVLGNNHTKSVIESIIEEVRQKAQAQLIQQVGKLLVFYRSSQKAKIVFPLTLVSSQNPKD